MSGDQGQGGSYVLRVRVCRDAEMAFGGFRRGRVLSLPAGDYSYVGSALGLRGATSLGRRLLRHATRTGGRPPHPIRAGVIESFGVDGPGGRKKALRWHVDYLLDHEASDLVAIIALRSPERMETAWGRLLEEDPHTRIVEKGLGAGDAPGRTHLLRVEADEGWWCRLPGRLFALRLGREARRV